MVLVITVRTKETAPYSLCAVRKRAAFVARLRRLGRHNDLFSTLLTCMGNGRGSGVLGQVCHFPSSSS